MTGRAYRRATAGGSALGGSVAAVTLEPARRSASRSRIAVAALGHGVAQVLAEALARPSARSDGHALGRVAGGRLPHPAHEPERDAEAEAGADDEPEEPLEHAASAPTAPAACGGSGVAARLVPVARASDLDDRVGDTSRYGVGASRRVADERLGRAERVDPVELGVGVARSARRLDRHGLEAEALRPSSPTSRTVRVRRREEHARGRRRRPRSPRRPRRRASSVRGHRARSCRSMRVRISCSKPWSDGS